MVRALQRIDILGTILLFFALGVAVYGFTLPHTFLALNDGDLIYNNLIVQHLTWKNIVAAFTQYDPELYIPFTYLSYQIDWWIGNGAAFVFHLDNLLLHILNALLVCWLMTLFSRNRWIGLFCGLVFLVHPIGTEAVMWVSARKDLLSTFFGRLTMILYMYYIFTHKKKFLYGGMALFLFALSAKVKVIMLPITMLLIDWKEGRPLSRGMFTEKAPYFVLSIAFGIVAFFGKQNLLESSPLSTKIFLSVKSAAFYLWHYIVPIDFSIYYPQLNAVDLWSLDFLLPLLLLLSVIALAIVSLRWSREIFFGCMLYLVGIIPSFTNLAKDPDIFIGSDRYAYTALVGITYAITFAVFLLWMRISNRQKSIVRIGLWILGGCIVATLSVLSYRQSLLWTNSETLFRHAIDLSPEYHQPYYDLGVTLDAEGKLQDAEAAYEQAIMLSDAIPQAYLNAGRDAYLLHDRMRAEDAFKKALALDPHFGMAHFNLAVMDAEDGKNDEALSLYRLSVQENPSYIDGRLNLAALESAMNLNQDAVDDLKAALLLDPENDRSRALAAAFIQKGILTISQ